MIVLKTTRELTLMKEACRISAAALRIAGAAVRPGVSTWEIDRIAYEYIKSQGAEPNFLHLYGFPATACISVNDEVIHGIPSKDRILKSGDIVSIDLGAKIHGYNGDNAATFACGEISDEAKRLLDTTRESLYKGIEAAVCGNKVGDIGHAVQAYCEARGYGIVREYTGHGVGKALHEDPSVPNYGTPGRGVRLVPGMTIAIEPMVNQGAAAIKQLPDGWTVKTADGKLAAHFEHTVAITKSGPVILTVE
ncbi:MAG: type I methionyl aminopeptidase [Clostridia bacterium]|nr:type I methionyl aminopeptidase [Clostridia bacterium]MBR3553634.1 type I methionyl aminopeptidase [Clostridia bacterium]